MPLLPSGITAAFGQSTAAMQAKMSGARGGRKSARKRRAKAKAAGAAPKRKRRAKPGAKLKAGSAAAKAWGRKMARLRKRK